MIHEAPARLETLREIFLRGDPLEEAPGKAPGYLVEKVSLSGSCGGGSGGVSRGASWGSSYSSSMIARGAQDHSAAAPEEATR